VWRFRCSVAVRNRFGLEQYLVVYRVARISEGGAVPLLQRLARIYLGPEVVFPPEPLRSRPGYVNVFGIWQTDARAA
jgi:hypothetical protein